MVVYYRVSHDSIIKSVSNILHNNLLLKIIIIIIDIWKDMNIIIKSYTVNSTNHKDEIR